MIWIIYRLNFNNAQPWNEDIIGESPEIVVIISDDYYGIQARPGVPRGSPAQSPGHQVTNSQMSISPASQDLPSGNST